MISTDSRVGVMIQKMEILHGAFGYDFFKNEFAGSVFLSGEIIRSAQAELKNSESDLKISENVKNGLKRL